MWSSEESFGKPDTTSTEQHCEVEIFSFWNLWKISKILNFDKTLTSDRISKYLYFFYKFEMFYWKFTEQEGSNWYIINQTKL